MYMFQVLSPIRLGLSALTVCLTLQTILSLMESLFFLIMGSSLFFLSMLVYLLSHKVSVCFMG